MYSPKVTEELIPVLYRLAKDRKMPMTRLVDGIIRLALASNNLPVGKQGSRQTETFTPQADSQQAVA